jgi:hypothetical protein
MVAQPAERHTDHHLHEKLAALARNAQVNVDLDDPADYWYRLGQRNAYAQALGLAVAQGVDHIGFEVADRLTGALAVGEHDVSHLLAWALQEVPAAAAASLEWLGPAAFRAQYGHVRGVDRDFGMRWGDRGNQRISWRAPLDASLGMLYAYDPLWDEYKILETSVPRAAVEAAFKQALESDIHMDVGAFGEIVRAAVLLSRVRPIEPIHAAQPVRVIEP